MHSERGLTVIEALLAGFVLVIGAMGMATVISDVLFLSTNTEDTNLAVQAAKGKLDELFSGAANDFGTVWLRYNNDPSDDPATGQSPGHEFDVTGLDKVPGKNAVGEIEFFLDESLAVTELGLLNNEGDNDPNPDPSWQGAIDIDGNGEFNESGDKLDPAGWSEDPPSHQILPVRITITWQDTEFSGEDRVYTLESILYQR